MRRWRFLRKIYRSLRSPAGGARWLRVVEHDMAFHRHIVEQGGGADLVAVWVPVVTHMMLPYSRHCDLMDSYREHQLVVEALRRGDKAASQECLRANIQ